MNENGISSLIGSGYQISNSINNSFGYVQFKLYNQWQHNETVVVMLCLKVGREETRGGPKESSTIALVRGKCKLVQVTVATTLPRPLILIAGRHS